ncbi:hypothetical protein GF359_02630 [candidate division WOR-3 bacterium]|uniref:Uncharacterized protein n=1 Tax=candidate division WOR-3 bacterium TaxID=2052148 RepID=A0A9D5K9H2_UNCW3|nr:hypothetical protein [candidate division WOR-3 bacterium]MBD3364090.1 hypothetical protein [candidate division WOR-3 bacterium]
MKKIGYLEGTDPTLLTKLAIAGHGTLPLGNGWDNHGKYVNHLSKEDNIDAVVGYFHKVFPPEGEPQGPGDMLFACRSHKIPVFLLVNKENQKEAKSTLKSIGRGVTLVDPAEAFDALTGKGK